MQRRVKHLRTPCARPILARLQMIIDRVGAGKFPNCTQLAEQMEVTTKTINRDIDYLRDFFHHDIDYDPRRYGYFYRTEPKPFLMPSVCLVQTRLEPVTVLHGDGIEAIDQDMKARREKLKEAREEAARRKRRQYHQDNLEYRRNQERHRQRVKKGLPLEAPVMKAWDHKKGRANLTT